MINNPTDTQYTLVIDASLGLQIALYRDETCIAIESTSLPVLENFDLLLDRLLDSQKLKIKEIANYSFCEGPGSILGIRTINVFLQALQSTIDHPINITAYNSLVLTAENLRSKGHHKGYLFTEYKRKSYQGIDLSDDKNQMVSLALDQLNASTDEHYHLTHRSGWPMPNAYQEVDYHIKNFDLPLLHKVSSPVRLPSVFTLAPSSFQKWTPAIHQKSS